MGYYLRDYTLAWWQIGLLKLAMLCIGIAIGAHWQQFFAPYAIYLFGVGLILGLYIAYVSFEP